MNSQSLSRQQWPFLFTMFGCAQFVVLTVVAMFFYPGGTFVDPATEGYSFFRNFFSDLGRIHAHSGTSNTASAILFVVALTLAGLGLVFFFLAMPRFFQQARPTYLLSRLGSVAGLVSGLSFVGVAFTPSDVIGGLHRLFVQVAFLAFFVAVLFFIVAILRTGAYPNRYARVFGVFVLLLAAYLLLLFFGPSLKSARDVIIQATGQKIIVYAAIVAAFILADGARRLTAADAARRPDGTG
ncbi:MAG: DUF998 domain-containing protein [Anaerolineae bacterium]|nr:DUF998 domain-containing protein [Anaerolineae bacterium]